jgi:hypothetical protein
MDRIREVTKEGSVSKGRSSCKKDSHKKKGSVKGGIGKEKKN